MASHPPTPQETPEVMEGVRVLDIVEDKGADVPVKFKQYPVHVNAVLEPQDTDEYICRWIHVKRPYTNFDEFISVVEHLIRDRDYRERQRIVDALARHRDDDERKSIIDALTGDREDGKHQRIIDALARYRDDGECQSIIDALTGDIDHHELRRISNALTGGREDSERQRIIDAFTSDDMEDGERQSTIDALTGDKEGRALQIIFDATRDIKDDKRESITDALHAFRRRYEVTGANGPIFEPIVVPLFEDDEQERIFSSPARPAPAPKFPVAFAMPVIRPWDMTIMLDRDAYWPKILLGYHYKFNTRPTRGWSSENQLVRQDQAPCIFITWAVAVDRTHLQDELRILKDIGLHQKGVVSGLARMIARHMFISGPLANVGAHTDESQGDGSTPNRPPPTKAGINSAISEVEDHISDGVQRDAIVNHETFLREISLLDDTAKRISKQASLSTVRNQVRGTGVAIFVFTIVTIVFLPLSFVTSYMGMNTSDIRDMSQGQWLFWAVGGPVSVGVFLVSWLIAFKGPRWQQAKRMQRLNDGYGWKY